MMEDMQEIIKKYMTCVMDGCNKPTYSVTGLFTDGTNIVHEGHHCKSHFQEWCAKVAVELFKLNGMTVMKDGKEVDFDWMKKTIFMKERT